MIIEGSPESIVSSESGRASAKLPGGEPDTGCPRRVMIVTADMGGGHDAAAEALADQVWQLWPGSTLRWVDTLDVMGPAVGPVFRRIYVSNVQQTPWLYQFFYDSLWRRPWFARASKGFVAGWSGRRLAAEVDRFDPDLIISTYPLGSAGLDWLRRKRSLPVPVGAWVTDFAPHPFWVYPGIDTTYVMHPGAVRLALDAEPRARVRVGAPPVSVGFAPGDGRAARQGLGLPADAATVLVSCGSYGFGDVGEAVRAALAAGDRVQVLAACGHNDRLGQRLRSEFAELPPGRLQLLGWRKDMPEITRAADVVISNAGGLTALESLAGQRPVIMYRPIAAHGEANAKLMADVDLADRCDQPSELTRIVHDRTSTAPHRHRDAILAFSTGKNLGDDLLALAETGSGGARSAGDDHGGRWPLRAQDAFFLHTDSDTVRQQIGAVVIAEPEPGAVPLSAEILCDRFARRLPQLPALRRRILRGTGFGRPAWVDVPSVELTEHIRQWQADGGQHARLLLDRFWSEPIPLARPPWQILLIHRPDTDAVVIAFKFHHGLGDGISLINTFDRLVDPPDRSNHTCRPVRPPARRRAGLRSSFVDGVRIARGLWDLGRHAAAPRTDFNYPVRSGRRGLLTGTVDSRELSHAATARHVRSSELLLALVAEALGRAGFGVGDARSGRSRIRIMVPVAMALSRSGRTRGNCTGVLAVNLPTGPMPFADRLAQVRRELQRRAASGDPEAGAFVTRAIGDFPAPVHAWMSRRVYSSRFFNLLISYVPGSVRPRRLAGNVLSRIYPVVALADGVPLGIGMMRYAGTTGVCFVFDEELRPRADRLRAAFDGVVEEITAAARPDHNGRHPTVGPAPSPAKGAD
ncbi:MAG: DUF1298 domain-containing protein [Microlunatus sp.]|nr:DUF1298 domain-containing protein [Microlunatus sp.]